MQANIFHTANSGLYFWDGETGILVDGLYRGGAYGFSDLPQKLEQKIISGEGNLPPISGLIFTHCHPDHFDPDLLAAVKSRYNATIYAPGYLANSGSARFIRPGVFRLRIGQAYILGCATTHDGAAFADTPHYSYLLRMAGESFFIAGDAKLQGSEADFYRGYHGEPIEGAFINVYQALLPNSIAFLRRLAPQHIYLYHLPAPDDDCNGFIRLAQQAIRRFPQDLPSLELVRQMDWIGGSETVWDKERGYHDLFGNQQHRSLL